MLILYYVLLFMYLGLALSYAATPPDSSPVPAWPLVSVPPPEEALVAGCANDADCPPFHACLGGQCVPKLQRAEGCNPATGSWISYVYGGADFAICVCSEPELIDQRLFGGDCDAKVGCGVHGTFDEKARKCECEFGYEARGLACKKLPAAKLGTTGPCEADEVENTWPHFHPDYRPPARCVKRPCSFDALSGRPLKRGKFVPDWGCVCDPRYGLFGASLAGVGKKYLKTEGYDACALLFQEEPDEPRHAELVTYFYLGEREPLSVVLFKRLSNLAPPFAGVDLMIGQKLWRYDYAQYFFRTHPKFRARQRYTTTVYQFPYIDYPVENHFSDEYEPPLCQTIPNDWTRHKNPKVDVYRILYWYPVCKMSRDHPKTPALFYDRVVVNPQHLTFPDYKHLYRANAFSLSYEPDRERWTLNLDHEYKVENYQNIQTNAPYYHVDTTPLLLHRSGILG